MHAKKSSYPFISRATYSVMAFVHNIKRRLFLKRNVYRSMKPEIDRFMAEFDKENTDSFGREYKMGCINSALKAYCSLCADGHSGYSISETMAFLRRMVNHLPLTPLTEDESEWNEISDDEDGRLFQSTRCPNVFKTVSSNGTTYRDINRVVKLDLETGLEWSNGWVTKMVDERFPITMPYMPSGKRFVVECREFDSKNANPGMYDTVLISRIVPTECNGEPIEVNKMYKEATDEKGRSTLVEIDENEYGERYANYLRFIGNRESD